MVEWLVVIPVIIVMTAPLEVASELHQVMLSQIVS